MPLLDESRVFQAFNPLNGSLDCNPTVCYTYGKPSANG